MARTKLNIKYNLNITHIGDTIVEILTVDGYTIHQRGEEYIWEKSTERADALYCIKAEMFRNVVSLVGWIKMGIGTPEEAEYEIADPACAELSNSIRWTMKRLQTVVK